MIATLGDTDRICAQLAADALIAIGDAAVPALLAIMESQTGIPRMEAARALAKIGDTRAIPALFAALDDDSALVRHWAELGLENMGVGMTFFNPNS